MEIHRTEEEQVQAIQQWWKENAVSIIAGIVIGIAVIVGYRYWGEHKVTTAQSASELYMQTIELQKKADDNFISQAEKLTNEYAATPYASMINLVLAKHFVENKNLSAATRSLNWVMENSSDEGMQHIARQRLARVLMEQGEYKSAENLVKGIQAAGFASGYAEIRGDLNMANNLPLRARENYRLALNGLTSADQRYQIIKMKLDNLAVEMSGAQAK